MQTKKKAAKKTYKSAKKTLPKTKITAEGLAKELAAAHAKTEAALAMLAENHAKTEAKLAENHAKTEAKMAENHAKTEAVFEMLAAVQAKTEASIDRLSVVVSETSAAVQELHAEVMETSISVRQLNDTLGGMGGHLGEVIEFIVIPKIRPAINALGNHSFKEITARKIVETVINDRKRKLTEVDVLLYGDTEAMAVEIKTCLQTSDVDKHLERLQKLRDHEADAEINGKTLFGAVVGAIVHDPIRAYALKKGLYVIEIREEEDKLDIDKPETCRTW
jgi:hypothetical protein